MGGSMIRADPKFIRKLDKLVEKGKYRSRSEATRELTKFIDLAEQENGKDLRKRKRRRDAFFD